MSQPVTAVIVGAGHRAEVYAGYAQQEPDRFRIVGIAEPDEVRRQKLVDLYNMPPEHIFLTAQELADRPAFADAAINGTMDAQHVPTTLPLLEAGYHVLLEKPVARSRAELMKLVKAVGETDRKLMICHVLRYAPFYAAIKKCVESGKIGELLSIRTSELVAYHHMATCFVRGKWGRRDDQTPMLMQKCCHDLDLLAWMKSGTSPVRVSSFGNLMYFRPEKAPEGAGTRCLVDCEIESDCPYSARKNYIEMGLWPTYVWRGLEHIEQPTMEQKIEFLRTQSPHGRCVWDCDNDVVDHQTVAVEFKDGCVATHNMFCATSRPGRTIHLIGSHGEIEGFMEDGIFVVRHPDARKGHEYSESTVDAKVSGDMHGGGDMRLVADFVQVIRGEVASISTTHLADSINGQLLAYAADEAMQRHQVVDLEAPSAENEELSSE